MHLRRENEKKEENSTNERNMYEAEEWLCAEKKIRNKSTWKNRLPKSGIETETGKQRNALEKTNTKGLDSETSEKLS